jgi:hypothetical protein
MEPIGCPETSVQNYHSTQRNIPEERISHLHRDASLKSLFKKEIRNNSKDFRGI